MIIFNPIIEKKIQERYEDTEIQNHAKLLIICFYLNIDPFQKIMQEQWYIIYRSLFDLGILERDYQAQGEGEFKFQSPVFVITETSEEAESTEALLNNRNIDEFVDDFAWQFRALWSVNGEGKQGLRPGALGDEISLKKKLKKWFRETKFKYSWQDILNTGKYYVSLQSEQNYKYLQACDYFVYKDSRSRLTSLVEEGKTYNVHHDLNTGHDPFIKDA